MEDFALISDVQRERIIAIREGVVRQITKGKNHQIRSEKYCNCTSSCYHAKWKNMLRVQRSFHCASSRRAEWGVAEECAEEPVVFNRMALKNAVNDLLPTG